MNGTIYNLVVRLTCLWYFVEVIVEADLLKVRTYILVYKKVREITIQATI